jgi:hypothetical protein
MFHCLSPENSGFTAETRRAQRKQPENAVGELRNLRYQLISDFGCKLMPYLDSLRPLRLCGE